MFVLHAKSRGLQCQLIIKIFYKYYISQQNFNYYLLLFNDNYFETNLINSFLKKVYIYVLTLVFSSN